MQETTLKCGGNERKKKSHEVLLGNKCALGLPAKAYRGNKRDFGKGKKADVKLGVYSVVSFTPYGRCRTINVDVLNASQMSCCCDGMGHVSKAEFTFCLCSD